MLRTVVVSLKDDPSTGLHGILWSTRGPWFTLKEASLVKPDGKLSPIDGGEVVVHRDNVSFMQVQT
jgi:hypothetical protein